MELDELKQAWQAIGQRLERQQDIQWQLLRDSKLDRARRHLRGLFWGQALQMVLGIGLIVLGVACWSRNTDVPGLLVAGVAVHAFGVLTTAMAGLTIGLAGSIDYSAPVMAIQKRMGLLLRFFTLNANLCGAPWWIMWVLVVVAFAGLGDVDPNAGTPTWITASLAIGLAGLLATWGWMARRRTRATNTVAAPGVGHCSAADGSDGIRRGQRLLDEIARFERE